MGVPKFYSWLRSKNVQFRGILQRNVPGIVSSLSVDMNGLLHSVAQIVFAYGKGANPERERELSHSDEEKLYSDYFAVLSNSLLDILTSVAPADILILSVDGVAPQAKINAQRARRFASSTSSFFNSNVISPGTEFMFRVDEYLKKWIAANSASLPSTVIYSSHMVAGEAEHKILAYYRDNMLRGVHCLYGLDADLVILALGVQENMIVMREDIRDIVNISNLKEYITQTLQTPTAISDFMILSFFLGNDFLPNSPALENLPLALDSLLQAYVKIGKSILQDGEINYHVLLEILALLDEEKLLSEELKRLPNPPKDLKSSLIRKNIVSRGNVETIAVLDYVKYSDYWYKESLGAKDLIPVAEKLLGRKPFLVTEERKENMVQDYLVGLTWILKYYTGKPFNLAWFYPYHYAPLLKDIQKVKEIPIEKTIPNDNPLSTSFLNVPQQLTSILPLPSVGILPEEMVPLVTGLLADEFPEHAIVKQKSDGADWHKIILLPFLDEERVVLATPAFTPSQIEKYAPQNEIVITRQRFQTYEKPQRTPLRGRGRGTVRTKPMTSYTVPKKDWKAKKPLL